MEEKIVCPKCKGCGEIPPPRKSSPRVKSPDPLERYCYKCKSFKSIDDDFYKNKEGKSIGYCKKCQCRKKRSFRSYEKIKKYVYKYNCTCNVCGQQFLGYKKTQYSCSRRCHMIRLNGSINSSILEKLPNELVEQLKEEGFYDHSS